MQGFRIERDPIFREGAVLKSLEYCLDLDVTVRGSKKPVQYVKLVGIDDYYVVFLTHVLTIDHGIVFMASLVGYNSTERSLIYRELSQIFGKKIDAKINYEYGEAVYFFESCSCKIPYVWDHYSHSPNQLVFEEIIQKMN